MYPTHEHGAAGGCGMHAVMHMPPAVVVAHVSFKSDLVRIL